MKAEYVDEGIQYFRDNQCSQSDAARFLINKYFLTCTLNAAKKAIGDKINSKKHLGLKEECEKVQAPAENVGHYWVKTDGYSIFVKNDTPEESHILDTVRDILSDYKPNYEPVKLHIASGTNQKALKATITDAHVGMEPNKDNSGIFKYEYNAEIFNLNIDHVIQSIIKEFNTHGRFDELIIQDLGDPQDGVDNMTTRKGHTLQQNLDNVGQFKTYVFGKLRLAETVIKLNIADKVVFRTAANCNHAGWFSEISNITIQSILSRVYEADIFEFHIQREFIDFFEYGDHTFIMTHGKDKEHMKHGLPKYLDAKTERFINSYIDHHEINTKYIHFEKGDLHCSNVDRSKKFDYRNFMSFAPPSGWAQPNFGDSYSGYSIQVIPKHAGNISHSDYIFEFKKAKRMY